MIAFFFDIDGTLLPFGKSAPESAVRAIRELRAMGHKAFLATGRSIAEVLDEVKAIGFDGGVYAAGAHVVAGDETIYRRTMTVDEKDRIRAYCAERGYPLLLQTNDATYLTEETLDLWVGLLYKHIGRALDVPNLAIVDALPWEDEVNKLLYISEGGKLKEIQSSVPEGFSVVANTVGLPGDLMGEIVLSDITKATGIDHLLSWYGIPLSSSAAIGDGANDIEMVEHCGSGIAMGNASPELKAAAGWITDDIEEDGLEKAIRHVLSSL